MLRASTTRSLDQNTGRKTWTAVIIPNRAWLEFETDTDDQRHIDKARRSRRRC